MAKTERFGARVIRSIGVIASFLPPPMQSTKNVSDRRRRRGAAAEIVGTDPDPARSALSIHERKDVRVRVLEPCHSCFSRDVNIALSRCSR